MVELDGEGTFFSAVSGHSYDGNGQRSLEACINGDDAFDGTRKQKAWILIQKIGAMAMTNDEVEELLLQKRVLNTAEDRGCVALADFGDHDADSGTSLFSEPTREGIGVVVERCCRL